MFWGNQCFTLTTKHWLLQSKGFPFLCVGQSHHGFVSFFLWLLRTKLASSQPHTRWTTVWRFWRLWLAKIIEINECRTVWISHYFYIIVNIANFWWEKWPRPNTLTKIFFSALNRQLSLTLCLISGICEEVMDPSALCFYILSESSRLTQFFSYMNIALL